MQAPITSGALVGRARDGTAESNVTAQLVSVGYGKMGGEVGKESGCQDAR